MHLELLIDIYIFFEFTYAQPDNNLYGLLEGTWDRIVEDLIAKN